MHTALPILTHQPLTPAHRLAAEARAAALQAGQAQSARELASLQSLFRQAVEESRGLLGQLAASRARVAALEAAAAVAAHAPPPPLLPPLPPPPQEQGQLPQQDRYPAIYARPASPHAADAGAAPKHAAPCSGADQLGRAKRALVDQLADTPQQAQQPSAPWQAHHTTISLSAFADPPGHLPAERQGQAADIAPLQPLPVQPPAAPPPGDLHRVFSELQALQRRLQAAEERLQLQASQAAEQQQRARPPSPGRGGGSRPASPGAAARRPASPARQKAQEHQDSYQLIRELKQRRARLEAERLAAAAAALAAGAQLRGGGARSPPPAGPPASGARAAPWLFDTQDSPAGAALHQPLPRQATAHRATGGTGSWVQQAAVRGWGAGQAGGSRSSRTSPMASHAANQQLPATAGGSSRGRRRSLSAVSVHSAAWP